MRSGLLISTRALTGIAIDPSRGVATVAAGARWGEVVAEAAKHGLAPITGSSPLVGVTGFLLGGGIGPLARSHGFGSDYLIGARVVLASGDVVQVDSSTRPELLWALRGGKPAIGVITELTLKLVPLRTLYAGSLYFEERHLESAFRAWIDWTARADPRVTSSAALAKFPPFDAIPPELRGRRLLVLRFTFPGEAREGAQLAAALRAFAPVYVDALGEMPITDIARIHNDPTQPTAVWVSGLMLDRVDQDFATVMLEAFDPERGSPFPVGELRLIGEATRRDVPGGSAVGGRDAGFVLGYLGFDPAPFERVLPEASQQLIERTARWRSPVTNSNFIGEAEHLVSAWAPATSARLREIERAVDPHGMFKPPSA